jgi:phage-related protein
MKVATAVATGVQAAFNAVMAMNPITLIVIAVAALAAGLIWFFTQTKLGQQIWAAFVKGLTDGWNVAVKAIGDFFAAIPGVLAKVGTWFSDAFNNLPKFIGGIWTKIIGTVTGFVTNIVNGIDKVFPGFKTVFNNVVNFFKGIINSMIGMVEGYVNFWIRGVNLIVGALNKVKFDIPNWVPVIGGQKWGFTLPLVPEIKLPRLAKGGTVMPSPGGSLVNVAEAGRPERIEPLDSNGLSNQFR